MHRASQNSPDRPHVGANARGRRPAVLLLGAVVLVALPWAASAREPRVGMAGNSSCLWVYNIGRDAETGASHVAFALREASDEKARYWPVPAPGVGTRIAWVAVSGETLHLIFADGTQRSLHFPTTGRIHVAELRPEARLPGDALPLALAADAGVVYAVVAGPGTRSLRPPPTSAPSEAEHDGEPAVTTASADESAVADDTGCAYSTVRYELGEWRFDRDLPPELASVRAVWLAVRDGTYHVWYALSTAAGTIHYRRGDQNGWSAPSSVGVIPAEDVLAVAAPGADPMVVLRVARRDPATIPVDVLVRSGVDWRRVHLQASDKSPVDVQSAQLAASAFGDQIALAIRAEANVVRVGLWSTDGTVVESAEELNALSLPEDVLLDEQARLILPFAVLGALLLTVLGLRRSAIVEAAELPSDRTVASFARRVGGSVLDLLLVSPLTYPVLRNPLTALRHGGASSIADQQAIMTFSYDLFWYWLAAMAIYVFYCALFEATLSATPGKLVFRCRVCDERGRRASLRRVLVRNLVRLVEMFPVFELLPSMVLIVLTPKKQRLGDLMAGTIVVFHPRSRDTDADVDRRGD